MAARTIKNVSYNFTDQVVLVTGAARGQGRAHALSFAAAGATVVALDIAAPIDSVPYPLGTAEQLDRLAADVESLDVRCLPIQCDLRDGSQIKAAVDRALAEFGRIDVLVNNAGIESIYPAVDMPESAWDDMINTNLRGPFLTSKYVAPAMIEQGRGKIVNTGSMASFVAIPDNAHYVAAKHGIIGLTKALALELAPKGINVNAVCPGAIDTPMNEGLFANEQDWIMSLGGIAGPWNLFADDPATATMLAPEEISNAILWLASDAADFVTGAWILVDSGGTIK
jgi:NAD(P)-dependent dehydrogenase (short-subunit alcohol dehydrogenase family)